MNFVNDGRRHFLLAREPVRDVARQLVGREADLLRKFHELSLRPLRAARTRIHGDYHLGQLLRMLNAG